MRTDLRGAMQPVGILFAAEIDDWLTKDDGPPRLTRKERLEAIELERQLQRQRAAAAIEQVLDGITAKAQEQTRAASEMKQLELEARKDAFEREYARERPGRTKSDAIRQAAKACRLSESTGKRYAKVLGLN